MACCKAGSSIFGSWVNAIKAVLEFVSISLKASSGHLFITLMSGNLCFVAKYPLGSITVISKFKVNYRYSNRLPYSKNLVYHKNLHI